MNTNKEYRNTTIGYPNKSLYNVVDENLPQNSTLLILGIGNGKDIKYFSDKYTVTGSDFSKLLLSAFNKANPQLDLITLDPVELNTKRTFDCIFSNKVMNQMDEDDFVISLNNQVRLLNENGMAIHSLWSGNGNENHHGLTWVYYTEEKLKSLIPKSFEIIKISTYKQNIDTDSLVVVLKKTSKS